MTEQNYRLVAAPGTDAVSDGDCGISGVGARHAGGRELAAANKTARTASEGGFRGSRIGAVCQGGERLGRPMANIN
jgi:hypothetical protein